MSLLSEYTLSLLENDKVVVDFTDTSPSYYEVGEILRFFRKYKKEVYIDFEGEQIFFMVLPWQHWGEFLIHMGFQDTAEACCEVLNDLEADRTPTMEEYITKLKQAKPVKDYKKEEATMEKNTEQYDELKQIEIDRLMKEKNLLFFKPKSDSEIAFEKDLPMLLAKYEDAFVAYIKGKIVGFDDDETILIENVMFEKHKKPDLVRKIEEIKEKEQEELE